MENKKILIVEDQDEIADLLQLHLSDLGLKSPGSATATAACAWPAAWTGTC
ncbi:hypothetical protein [Aliamphritea spongicola]|nr:hypothetical protein [Aliamphritea spongicola]